MKKLFIDYHPRRVRVAMTEDGELVEYYIERASQPKLVGNIYRGKVVNVLSGMKAAFVNIGLEKNAFLYVGDNSVCKEKPAIDSTTFSEKLLVSAGDNILCQVVKDHFGSKGVRISQNVSLPGRYLVYMPQMDYVGISHKIDDEEKRLHLEQLIKSNCCEDIGFIVRTAAAEVDDNEIISEMNLLIAKWKNIVERYTHANECDRIYEEGDLIFRTIRDILDSDIDKIVVNNKCVYDDLNENLKEIYPKKDILELYTGTENFFSYYSLTGQIDKLLKRKVVLKNGAYLIIDRTEAFTVIDVNTGKYVGENNLEDTFLKTNLLASHEIAKQIRLRNLGGIIVIDFIDMTLEENREKVLDELSQALKRDRIRTSQPVMSNLGLVELTRKRTRSTIDDILLRECPYCHGDSYVFSEEFVIMRFRDAIIDMVNDVDPKAIIIKVHPEVFSKIFTMRYLQNDCATIWKGRRIYIIPDESLHHEKFTISYDNSVILNLPDNAKMLY